MVALTTEHYLNICVIERYMLMPTVLTAASAIPCLHAPGKVKIANVQTKLHVGGNPVLLERDVDGKEIEDCFLQDKDDSNGDAQDRKCRKVTAIPQDPKYPPQPPAITGGWAKKLMVKGDPVLLDTLKGKTDGMKDKKTPLSLGPTDSTDKLVAEARE